MAYIIFSPTLELVMHIYSADCDCAVCSMERFDAHVVEALEVIAESNMIPEEVELRKFLLPLWCPS